MDPIIERQTTRNGWKRALEREEGENMCTTHSPFPLPTPYLSMKGFVPLHRQKEERGRLV